MDTTLITIIIQYIKSILKSQGNINFSNIAKSISQYSLTRAFYKDFQWQKRLWDFFSPYLDLIGAYLVIDDTILEKLYSKASRVMGEIIRWVWSHKDNRSVKGIQIVVLLLVIGEIRFPIGFRIYDKNKTKIELALELLSYARNTLKLKKMFVLFDSWYSSKSILKRIKDYGWYFVCRIKRNRNVNGKNVKLIFPNPYGFMVGKINGVKISLVRNRKHYLITNCLSLGKVEILEWYSKRSIIEEFFKIIKSRFKAKCCQSKIASILENHLYLVFFCFCLVELKRIKLGITIYKAKLNLKLTDYTSILNKWKRFLANA